MTLDPLILSRLQWAWVIGWHILLPAFTVGMASYIAVLEGLHFFSPQRGLAAYLAVLDAHFRGRVRHGRGDRHRHAVPVRHQLVALFRCDRQCPLAACWPTRT